ncbi:hypothetical protein D3C86_1166640 [compost metagenome]
MLLVLEAALALLHLATKIGSGVEVIVAVRFIEVMQPIAEPTQGVEVQGNVVARPETPEDNMLGVNSSVGFRYTNAICFLRSRRTTHEDAASHVSTRLHLSKAGFFLVNPGGFGSRSVDVALDDRVKALREVIDQVVADLGHIQADRRWQDKVLLMVILPELVQHLGHELEDAAGALEALQGRPILVEPVEDLGMQGI